MRQLSRGYPIHILFARGIKRVIKNSEVWVVDDDASIRWVLERALVDAGLSVREFGDIDEAMRVMGHELPNVVMTDIKMPGRNHPWGALGRVGPTGRPPSRPTRAGAGPFLPTPPRRGRVPNTEAYTA